MMLQRCIISFYVEKKKLLCNMNISEGLFLFFSYVFSLWRIPMFIKYFNDFTLVNTRVISSRPFGCWLRPSNRLCPLCSTLWPTEVSLPPHLPKQCWLLFWDGMVRLAWARSAVFRGDQERKMGQSWGQEKSALVFNAKILWIVHTMGNYC